MRNRIYEVFLKSVILQLRLEPTKIILSFFVKMALMKWVAKRDIFLSLRGQFFFFIMSKITNEFLLNLIVR